MQQSILISLDALLDTRLGLINMIKPEYAKFIVQNPKNFETYSNRLQDEFPELGLAEGNFKSIYRERTSHVLPYSMATSLTYELKNIVMDLFKMQSLEPHRVSGINIDINVAPYKDIPEEILEEIVHAVEYHTGELIPVKTVYYPVEEVTPGFLKSSMYVAMFIYDFEEWVSTHITEETVKIPDYKQPGVSITAPLIAVSKENLKEVVEFEAPNGERCDVRDAMQITFAEFFRLEITDIGLFSIAHPGLIAYHYKLATK